MGALNPWVLLAGVLAFVCAVTGAYFYGDHVGSVSTEAAYSERDNKALKDAQDKLAAANAATREKEKQHAIDLAAISKTYQEELQDVESTKNKTIAALRAGAIRLRDPGTVYAPHPTGSPAFSTAPGRCNDRAGTELSTELAAFLTGEASRADAIANQLAECQTIIVKDRELCNGE